MKKRKKFAKILKIYRDDFERWCEMKKYAENNLTLIAKMKKFDIFDFISSLFFRFIIKLEVFVNFEKLEKPDILFLKLKNIYIEGNNSVRYF